MHCVGKKFLDGTHVAIRSPWVSEALTPHESEAIMYWVEECNGVWQVRKGERVVCILLSRDEAERLALALTHLKLKPSGSIPALSFL